LFFTDDVQRIKELIGNGMDVDMKDSDGNTPLINAAKEGDVFNRNDFNIKI
jgi:ankyrin repeat protein